MNDILEFTQDQILKEIVSLNLDYIIIDDLNIKVIGKKYSAMLKINTTNDALIIYYQHIQYNLYEMDDFSEFLIKLI